MYVVRIYKIDVANVGVENISVADESIPFVDPLKELVTAVEPGGKNGSPKPSGTSQLQTETAA